MKLSVVIPTYQRPQNLEKCLASLTKQERPADQIVVIAREGDDATVDVATRWKSRLPIEVFKVILPGTVEAVQRGIDAASGDIASMTDDDSEPYPDWLKRIERYFESDPALGGLGGRDIVITEGRTLPARDVPVGVVSWYGRIHGNHHAGMGAPREVDILKGVNMSFRLAALANVRLDRQIRGKGAPAYEPALSLAVKSSGWRLIYDPNVAVNHFIAPRPAFDERTRPSREAMDDMSFNYYLIINRYVRPRWKLATAILWAWVVGTPYAPGLLRGFRGLLKGRGFGDWQASRRMWKQARLVASGRSR